MFGFIQTAKLIKAAFLITANEEVIEMKKIIISLVILGAVLLAGCEEEVLPAEEILAEEQVLETETGLPDPEEELILDLPAPVIENCTHNENCTQGKLCIEGTCQILAELYELQEGCIKCRIKSVDLTTSDGDSYSLSPGQGSYTAAGALDWTILSSPSYCRGDEVFVPINILKRNYGLVFSDEVILLKEGETSKVIKHPSVKSVAFTLTVKNVEEACS